MCIRKYILCCKFITAKAVKEFQQSATVVKASKQAQICAAHIFTFYRGGSPTTVRPSDPALCGSCPLVTPYCCRLGDLLCFVFIV